jgi:hypothetical protein
MASRLTVRDLGYYVIPALTLASLAAWFGCGGSPANPSQATTPPSAPASAPVCDPSLWNHVHEPERLLVKETCRTVTGTKVNHHLSRDGDVVMQVAVDPEFQSMLNTGNRQSLEGRLQVEAVCQAPVLDFAEAACEGFTGKVLIPPDGSRVQITGTVVHDFNHGWIEIHPVSVLTVLR